jgi:glycerophosphoryl diester phosphodiesterase
LDWRSSSRWAWVTLLALLLGCGAPACGEDEIDPTLQGLAPRPLVIAHRGASGHRPEHTLAAYELAMRMGADYIEPDLVSTKDGVLVARHENDIGRTTDVGRKFGERRAAKVIDGDTVTGWFTEDFTLAELRTLRVNERESFRTSEYDGIYSIPTFEEVVTLAEREGRRRGRVVGLYPELKHPRYFREIGLALEERVLEVLRRHDLDHCRAPVFIQSFDSTSLRRLRTQTVLRLTQLVQDSSWLTSAALREIATYADGVGVFRRLLVREEPGVPPTSVMSDAHAVGLDVHAWTLRPERQFLAPRYGGDPLAEVRELAALGVDGMFGDYPDQILKALGVSP